MAYLKHWILGVGSLLACGGFAACGSAESAPGGSDGTPGQSDVSGAPIAIEDLCPVFRDDLCTYLTQCGGQPYRDIEHCKAQMHCFGLEQLEESAAAGRVAYNPDAVGDCHARFASDPCGFAFFLFTPDIFEVLAECEDTIEPLVEDGSSCVSSGECKSGLCSKEDRVCPGVCEALGRDGDPCTSSNKCAPGYFCTSSDTCALDPQAGDACIDGSCGLESISIGEDEPEDDPEAGELFCEPATNTCLTKKKAAESCGPLEVEGVTQQHRCQDNLFCSTGLQPTEPGTCLEESGDGGPCWWDPNCADGFFCEDPDRFDEVAGTCVAEAGEGDPCVAAGCGDDLTCEEGVCVAVPPKVLGENCGLFAGSCEEGLECGSDQTCVVPHYPGDACDPEANDCILSMCQDGICVNLLQVGDSCTSSDQCAVGACSNSVCVDTSVCAAP